MFLSIITTDKKLVKKKRVSKKPLIIASAEICASSSLAGVVKREKGDENLSTVASAAISARSSYATKKNYWKGGGSIGQKDAYVVMYGLRTTT